MRRLQLFLLAIGCGLLFILVLLRWPLLEQAPDDETPAPDLSQVER